jgi:hypothetical protein
MAPQFTFGFGADDAEDDSETNELDDENPESQVEAQRHEVEELVRLTLS